MCRASERGGKRKKFCSDPVGNFRTPPIVPEEFLGRIIRLEIFPEETAGADCSGILHTPVHPERKLSDVFLLSPNQVVQF